VAHAMIKLARLNFTVIMSQECAGFAHWPPHTGYWSVYIFVQLTYSTYTDGGIIFHTIVILVCGHYLACAHASLFW